MKGSNNVAIGYDEGIIMIKVIGHLQFEQSLKGNF